VARIDAFAVLVGEGEVSVLAASLSKVLPTHMMPVSITVLDALPRTANGEKDAARVLASRLALNAGVEPERPTGRLSRVPELIGRLRQIWSEA
jgi:hypothetical protein